MLDTAPQQTAPVYRTPALFTQFGELTAAESTRHGGISPAPYHSLNLGYNTNDRPENTTENRRLFFTALGIRPDQLASSHQCHSTSILTATQSGRFDGYDALITNKPGLLVAVSIADCVPILVYDQVRRVVAAVHAGWRGTVGGIVSKTLQTMQKQFGTQPGDCMGYVGTCIDETSFEVGPEVADAFAAEFVRASGQPGTFLVDLKRANARQLTDFGLPAVQIELSPYSTVLNNNDYFSHRAERGTTGRMLAVIGLKSNATPL